MGTSLVSRTEACQTVSCKRNRSRQVALSPFDLFHNTAFAGQLFLAVVPSVYQRHTEPGDSNTNRNPAGR